MVTPVRPRARLVPFLAASLLAAACGGRAAEEAAASSVDCAACAQGSACLRGVCVAECGLDVAALDAELAPGLVPVAHVCTTLRPGPIGAHATARDGSAIALTHVSAEPQGDDVTLRLERLDLALPLGRLTAVPEACTTTYRARRPGLRVELAPTLGLSPGGAHPHFGVRAVADGAHERAADDASYVLVESCVFEERRMHRYGGAAMTSEDPRDLVVQGAPDEVGGLGLYRGEQLLAPASALGSVGRLGTDRLLAATSVGHGAVSLAAYPTAALASGPFPVRGETSTFGEHPRDLVVLPDRGIVGRKPMATEDARAFWLYSVRVDGDRLDVGAPVSFASARFTQVVAVGETRRVVLQHDRGLLVVE